MTAGAKRVRSRSSGASATPVDPRTGLIPFVITAEIEPGDPDVFVCACQTIDTTIYGLPHRVSGNGSGAGLTLDAAWGAAVGEGVERYAMSICPHEDLVFGSYESLRCRDFLPVDPRRWALFDASQYGRLPFVPFQPETSIGWIPMESLTYKLDVLAPASMVFVPYLPRFQSEGERVVSPGISTGAACAASRSESLLKGVCEIVERDAFMIMWRDRLTLPRVIIDDESLLSDVFHERFERPGLEYHLVYTTLDLGIPSFAGFVFDHRSPQQGVMVGGAAHPNPDRAALKTLLELAQGLQWKDHMHGSFQPDNAFHNVRSFEDRARLYATNKLPEAFEFVRSSREVVRLSDVESIDSGDVRRNLSDCVDRLGRRGLEVLAADLTPVDAAECGLFVTRVLVPGCEAMEGDARAPFLGGTRWRTVPCELGLKAHYGTIESCNPFPHPYP